MTFFPYSLLDRCHKTKKTAIKHKPKDVLSESDEEMVLNLTNQSSKSDAFSSKWIFTT